MHAPGAFFIFFPAARGDKARSSVLAALLLSTKGDELIMPLGCGDTPASQSQLRPAVVVDGRQSHMAWMDTRTGHSARHRWLHGTGRPPRRCIGVAVRGRGATRPYCFLVQ
jgi:hypothetical protein